MNENEISIIINIIDWALRNGYVIPETIIDQEEYREIQCILKKLIISCNLSEKRLEQLKDDYELY